MAFYSSRITNFTATCGVYIWLDSIPQYSFPFYLIVASSCEDPPPTDVSVVQDPEDLNIPYPHGTNVSYTCANGYDTLNESVDAICLYGNWTAVDAPHCSREFDEISKNQLLQSRVTPMERCMDFPSCIRYGCATTLKVHAIKRTPESYTVSVPRVGCYVHTMYQAHEAIDS